MAGRGTVEETPRRAWIAVRRIRNYISGSTGASCGRAGDSWRSWAFSLAVGLGAELVRPGECAVRDSFRRNGRPRRQAVGADPDHGLVVGLYGTSRCVP